MKTIAGIQFTNDGVAIVKPYVENIEVFHTIAPELFTGEFLHLAKCIAKRRMMHCYKELHKNLAAATHIMPDMIAWDGGHFTVQVWKALEEVLTLDDARKLNVIQCQQLIRDMLLNDRTWVYDYTENFEKVKDSGIHITEQFRMFITEQILLAHSFVAE